MESKSQKDTLINVQTPEGIGFSLYPAGMLIRLCSYLIDLIIQGVLFIVIVMVLADLVSRMYGTWIMLLSLFFLNWFYHVFCELCFNGQSAGKRIIGIRVVRSDGSPINPGASFIRNLLRVADNFFGLYIIVLSCMAVSPGFRRIGDLAADTLVVYTANSLAPTKKTTMTWLAKYEKIVPPRKLSNDEKQNIILFAKRYPILGEARANEIAKKYAESLRDKSGPDRFSDSEYLLGIAHMLSGGQG